MIKLEWWSGGVMSHFHMWWILKGRNTGVTDATYCQWWSQSLRRAQHTLMNWTQQVTHLTPTWTKYKGLKELNRHQQNSVTDNEIQKSLPPVHLSKAWDLSNVSCRRPKTQFKLPIPCISIGQAEPLGQIENTWTELAAEVYWIKSVRNNALLFDFCMMFYSVDNAFSCGALS